MADYNGWKVADLKAELKRRGIRQTGLRLKQHFIDRLLQSDSAEDNAAVAGKVASDDVASPGNDTTAPSVPQEATKSDGPLPEASQRADSHADLGTTARASTQEVSGLSQAQPQDINMPDSDRVTDQTIPEQQPDREIVPREPVVQEILEEQPKAESEAKEEPAALPDLPAPPAAAPSTETKSSAEEIDDSKKRKRRSQTPPPSPRSAALKRAKAEDGHPRVVLQEDMVSAETKNGPKEFAMSTVPSSESQNMEVDVPQKVVEITAEEQPTKHEDQQLDQRVNQEESVETIESEGPKTDDRSIATEAIRKENIEHGKREEEKAESIPQDHEIPQTQGEERVDGTHFTRKPTGDARFKGLFSANGDVARLESPPPPGDEERLVTPAIHPATTSLYIRDFMRPLQHANLKRHLISLATPPSATPDSDIILDFFLDSIKTHCFVTFTSVSAASRVRSALHDTIWPEERNRKPLWVDFIPEEKVKEWIEIERAPGNNRRDAARWEVVYEDREAGVVATLQEATPNSARNNNRNQSFNLGREPPTGPRAERSFGRGTQQAGPPVNIPDSGFKALDDRFLSTSAKPKLYYLPVSREVSDKRLDRFDDLARAAPSRRTGSDEMRRYSFEDTDFFVDKGPEYGSRRGRGPRGRGGGAFAEWTGSWRGRR
ncbi:hypothetical protein PRK78_001994 [Emydomyces testavorans]|uniref:SAP domain-containing protein n=1 Tax=Emydomyces testavorans TaxID=2070801 RepID=A0AAF0IH71_9EURO|nr:hypothetical protein PRK78_001994 [Emydomyces testavorans]